MANVYAPSVQMDTVRRQVNLEVQMQAHSATADATDAYHQGTPPDPMSEHGRHIFVYPLEGLGECDLAHMQRGKLWRVTGNVPGIQNAGVVWGDHFGGWLLGQGYMQSVVDRRLYYRRNDDDTLSIVCVYVDDNRMTSTSLEERAAYLQAFDRAFPNSVAPGALEASVACDFAGVRYEKIGVGADARIEASCPRLHAKLRIIIETLPPDQGLVLGTCVESPMAKDALVVLQLSSTTDALLDQTRILMAQQIAGLGGFIVLCSRPDAYFAYVVLSQYLAHGLTQTIWNALIRWATYIYVNTALRLTYWASSNGKPWVVYVDSSLFNAPNSRSMGGYLALYEGSGAFAWRCFSPRKLASSSGGSETIMASHASQYILGQRILDKELGIHEGKPNELYSNNLATLQGTEMENVPAKQRYLAARRAILRQVCTEEKIVRFLKVATDDNPADLFTKPLEGDQFVKLRAILMGVSAAIGPPTPAPPISQGAPKIDWVHFVKGLEADETSSSYELRRGSLPPEDLYSMTKNAGEIHGKHAASNANPPPQRSPFIGVRSSQHQASIV